jgi:hypothetical protein
MNGKTNTRDPVRYQLGDALQADGHEYRSSGAGFQPGKCRRARRMMNHLHVLGVEMLKEGNNLSTFSLILRTIA